MCSLMSTNGFETRVAYADPQEVVYHSPRVTERRHRMPETDENVEVIPRCRYAYCVQLMVSQISEKNMSSVCQLYFLFIVVAIPSRVVIRSERVEHTRSRLLRHHRDTVT